MRLFSRSPFVSDDVFKQRLIAEMEETAGYLADHIMSYGEIHDKIKAFNIRSGTPWKDLLKVEIITEDELRQLVRVETDFKRLGWAVSTYTQMEVNKGRKEKKQRRFKVDYAETKGEVTIDCTMCDDGSAFDITYGAQTIQSCVMWAKFHREECK